MNVKIAYTDLIQLHQRAKAAGTLDKFSDLAMEWAQSAGAEIARLRAEMAEARKVVDRLDWVLLHVDPNEVGLSIQDYCPSEFLANFKSAIDSAIAGDKS